MSCPFCSPDIDDEVVLDDRVCVAVLTHGRPVASAMVLPKAHRSSPFELTQQEWHPRDGYAVEVSPAAQRLEDPFLVASTPAARSSQRRAK